MPKQKKNTMVLSGRYIEIDKFGKMRFDMPTKFKTTIDGKETKDENNTYMKLNTIKNICPSVDIKRKTFGVTPERGVVESDLDYYKQEDCIITVYKKNYDYDGKIGTYLKMKNIRLKNFKL